MRSANHPSSGALALRSIQPRTSHTTSTCQDSQCRNRDRIRNNPQRVITGQKRTAATCYSRSRAPRFFAVIDWECDRAEIQRWPTWEGFTPRGPTSSISRPPIHWAPSLLNMSSYRKIRRLRLPPSLAVAVANSSARCRSADSLGIPPRSQPS